MAELSQLKCVACRGGDPTLTEAQLVQFMPQVPEWQVKEVNGEKRLERIFKFKNFSEAIAFTDKASEPSFYEYLIAFKNRLEQK